METLLSDQISEGTRAQVASVILSVRSEEPSISIDGYFMIFQDYGIEGESRGIQAKNVLQGGRHGGDFWQVSGE
jgi:hypothetical protein